MNSISGMYDDIFKSEVDLDSIFDGLRVENNPKLEPIEQMFNEVFQPEAVQDKRQFVKVEGSKAKELQYGLRKEESDEEEELVVGEPVYHNQYANIWNKDL